MIIAGSLWMWIGCAGFCAFAASGKGRGGLAWFVLGALFGPLALLGLIACAPAERLSTTDPDARRVCGFSRGNGYTRCAQPFGHEGDCQAA